MGIPFKGIKASRMGIMSRFLLLLAFGLTAAVEFTPCTEGTVGHCKCAPQSSNITTYSFDLNGELRCFTVDHPREGLEPLPVFLKPHCYSGDKYSNKKKSDKIGVRYGFSSIYLSQPTTKNDGVTGGDWTFGNDNVVNDENPMPCKDEDSKDLAYVRKVLEFIDSHPTMFQKEKIYIGGHSQNSMFSSYIGYCFNERIVGIWSGAGGLLLPQEDKPTPGCQGHMKKSDILTCSAELGGAKSVCKTCQKKGYGCKECQYWPIYPCYSDKRPMVQCSVKYENDGISGNGGHMYDIATAEGHDVRRFVFGREAGLKSGHSQIYNEGYWQVGCLGITQPCSNQCEQSFLDCMTKAGSGGRKRLQKWATCINFEGLEGCEYDCAPTYAMLAKSQEPIVAKFSKFGSEEEQAMARPSNSKCMKSKDVITFGQ